MKKIKEFMITTYDDKTRSILNTTWRKTEKGVSNWANKMFDKYGEYITVTVGYFDDDDNYQIWGTYHA